MSMKYWNYQEQSFFSQNDRTKKKGGRLFCLIWSGIVIADTSKIDFSSVSSHGYGDKRVIIPGLIEQRKYTFKLMINMLKFRHI